MPDAARQGRLNSHASGVALAFGSDWPCSSADPREGIAIAISRTTTQHSTFSLP
ncbi:MAG: hypothetical protein ABI255_04700 [Microbacteriaceae bacterium]